MEITKRRIEKILKDWKRESTIELETDIHKDRITGYLWKRLIVIKDVDKTFKVSESRLLYGGTDMIRGQTKLTLKIDKMLVY